MIYDMMPAKLVESDHFREFVETLNPKFKVPSRRTYMRTVKQTFDDLKTQLTLLLHDVKYVATTGMLIVVVFSAYFPYQKDETLYCNRKPEITKHCSDFYPQRAFYFVQIQKPLWGAFSGKFPSSIFPTGKKLLV